LEIIHEFYGLQDIHIAKMLFSCAARCFKQVGLLRLISDSEKTVIAGCVKISNGKCDAGQ